MAHQVVKYRLTAEGTIPEFIYFGNDGLHGYYGTYPTGADAQPSPRDLVQIGITDSGATGDFEVVSSQADLTAYLTSISDGWTQPAQRMKTLWHLNRSILLRLLLGYGAY